jgi:DUF4097 and DUF4098 domain-containing protein YvlB
MRVLLALAAAIVVALSGCTSTPEPMAEPGLERLPGAQFDSAPEQGQPAGAPGVHGEPTRDDGAVETGMNPLQGPGAWARRTVTLTNGFDGASFASVFAGVPAGSIQVAPIQGDGYRIEVRLEARGFTEQQARDNLDRLVVEHTDTMDSEGLHVATVVRYTPDPALIPGLTISLGSFGRADVVVSLPAGPAYDLGADTSSGDIAVDGLRGPAFTMSASSGDIALSGLNAGALFAGTSSGGLMLHQVQARQAELATSSGDIDGHDLRIGTLRASASSGDIDLAGVFNTLEVETSSGAIRLEATPAASGAYRLSTSSGDLTAHLRESGARAYRVMAEASSGTVEVQLSGSQSQSDDGDRVQAQSAGYDRARIQTVVEATASSGDITILGSEAGWDTVGEDDGRHGHPPGKA